MEPNDDEFLDDLMEKVKNLGHNSLSTVVKQAKAALVQIQKGEGITWEGWRDYGKALNEGREAFPSDEEFGQWVVSEGLDKIVSPNLGHTKNVHSDERVAAMWIAKSPKEEQEALELFPNARTPRGLHAKWKEHVKKLEEGEKDGVDDIGDDDNGVDTNSDDDNDTTEGVNTGTDKTEDKNTTTPSGTDKPKATKASMPIVPEYNVDEAMGAIKGIGQMFGQRYKGTTEEAAQVLLDRIMEGYDKDDVGLSIAKDYAKWFLSLKKVFDLVGPEVEDFLADKPNLTVVK